VSEAAADGYSGIDNLEVMAEALNYNAFLRSLVERELRPGDAVLDFGAGTGTLALPLAGAGHPVACVEPDPQLRGRLSAAGLTAHADLSAVPEHSLDFAYTVNVLEHIDDNAAAIAALRERLKPGGRLLVYVPAFAVLYSSMDRKVGHRRRYRRRELVALLERAGLTVERAAYCDSLGFFATLLFKLFGNDSGTIDRRALVLYDRWLFPLSRTLDGIFGRWFGKNLLAAARRDDAYRVPERA